MRSMRLLAVAVLGVVLALSAAQNAYAVRELSYDAGVDESWNCPAQNGWRAVRFVFSDFGLSGSWRLLTARFYQTLHEGGGDQVELHVLTSDGSGDLPGSTPVTFTTAAGWNDVSLSGQDIVVSGDFWIAYKWLGINNSPCVGTELSAWDGRSYLGLPGSWAVDGTHDYMIRAVIDSLGSAAPVGGFMEPVNRLAVFAPYLALFGLVAVVIVAVAPWEKPGI
jgi:hypothetical protein